MRVFVPEGLNDSSQAIYCLECVQKGDPSRRDGVIGSNRRATIRTINQLGVGIRPCPTGRILNWTCSRQWIAWLLSSSPSGTESWNGWTTFSALSPRLCNTYGFTLMAILTRGFAPTDYW